MDPHHSRSDKTARDDDDGDDDIDNDNDKANDNDNDNAGGLGEQSPLQPNAFERFLSQLFEERFLTNNSASADPGPPPPQPANSLVPFFPSTTVLRSVAPLDPTPGDHPSDPSRPIADLSPLPATDMNCSPSEDVVFCVEDTVGLKDDRYSVGVVDRSFGDVDTHEPRPQRDYGEDIERHPDVAHVEFDKFMKSGIPPRGTVLVSWQTQLKTELIPESKLQLLDRALYVGDVVKRTAQDPMSGTVIGTKAVCTLFPATMFNSGQITQSTSDDLSIRNVPAQELINVHEYNEGALVVCNDWIGRVENVYDEIAIKLANNSVVVVDDPGDLEMDDVTLERLSVGDTVKTKKGNLRRGRWKFGAFDPNVKPHGMVVETRTIEIDVHWLAKRIGPSIPGRSSVEPPATLVRDDLESGDVYVYDASRCAAATLPMSENGSDRSYHVVEVAVGDRVKFKDIMGAVVKYDGTHTLPNGYPQGKISRIPRTETLGYDMNVYLVMQTHTQVTVQWQDLTVTEDLSSSLLPDPNVEDDDEVWPGEIVCTKEKRPNGDADVTWASKPAKIGIVQAVKSRDRLAAVRWYENPSISFLGDDLIPPVETGKLGENTEDVSIYDIQSTPSLTRRRGDFVLVHIDGDLNQPSSTTGPDWFGEVIDLGLDGMLTVRLGAAKPVVDIKVPYERVTLAYSSDMESQFLNMDTPEGDSIEDSEDGSSDFDSASFNEMWIEYEGMDGEPMGNEEDWATEDEEDDSDDDDSSMPDLEPADGVDTLQTTPEVYSDIEPKSPPLIQTHGNVQRSSPRSEDHQAHPGIDTTESLSPFVVLDTPPPSNHRYFTQHAASSPNFMRRIGKEHKILRSSLPPGIFVRTWESRLDLIRVLMIGPSETPYEYAPFVIDFHLGSTYPQTPPEAFFHSWTNGNGPINPNLYEDGKICLSLLGTWHADERNECWSPAKSTLLQVLVSLMGLVLVKEPYYNEAGYDVHRAAPETKLNSALYTERAYFRARAFITHALTNDVEPFAAELRYLYHSKSEGAPRLLDRAIEAGKGVLERSANGRAEEERDGLRTISLGAVVMLRRQVETLESLRFQAA